MHAPASHPYWDRRSPDHRAAVAEVERLSWFVHGTHAVDQPGVDLPIAHPFGTTEGAVHAASEAVEAQKASAGPSHPQLRDRGRARELALRHPGGFAGPAEGWLTQGWAKDEPGVVEEFAVTAISPEAWATMKETGAHAGVCTGYMPGGGSRTLTRLAT